MLQRNRRDFLSGVGRGMFIAGLGANLAIDMGFAFAREVDEPKRLTFGMLEPLVSLMQDTPAAKLMPMLVKKIEDGTTLKDLIAAASFANARTFGGEDYIGFHTLMALAPAYNMSKDLPKERKALPVLKILYRNTNRIQEKGGSKQEVLVSLSDSRNEGEKKPLLDFIHKKDIAGAERAFQAKMGESLDTAFNYLLEAIEDSPEVHRVVLPYRAYAMLDFVGKEQAHTMLRQSVHYCVKNENPDWSKYYDGLRATVPKLMDQYKLPTKATPRKADDAWIANMCDTLFTVKPEAAAEAVAAALAEGFDIAAISDAICLAANQLVLRDEGRTANQVGPGKPVGSCHGDSIGVHASDTANAWRHLAQIADARHSAASMIVAGWQVANDRIQRGGDFQAWKARPLAEHLEMVKAKEPKALLAELEEAIRHNEQNKACAVAVRCGEAGMDARSVFDVLLKYAISEEGALHAEKYYQTATEEFGLARPAFRWRQVASLARVTASEFGTPAAGMEDICKLLNV